MYMQGISIQILEEVPPQENYVRFENKTEKLLCDLLIHTGDCLNELV
jgi:hypothetical protein